MIDYVSLFLLCKIYPDLIIKNRDSHMTHSQMLGKVESGGGLIFKVVLEC